MVLAWVLLAGIASAQITPESRDRTYQQAAPDRFERRFEQPETPKSTVIPVQPDTLKPVFPPGLKDVKFVLKSLIIKGTTVYTKRQFTPMFRRLLNREVSLEHIYRVANIITRKYRNDGYILSRAVVPPQKIENGVVRIEIVEGYIDKVNIQGKVRGPRELLNAYRRNILASKPLHSKDLERYLLLIDDLPGVTAKSVLTPSENQPGATDLSIILDNKPFEASAGTDNRGTEFNGPMQVFGGVATNSLFGGYEKTGVQTVFTSDPDELFYFNAYHEMPLSSEGTKLTLSGSVSKSKPGDVLKDFEVEGDSSMFQFKLEHPFIRSRGENLTGYFSFTHRNSQTDILGTKDSEDRLRIMKLGASYDFADRYLGVNVMNFNIHRGLNIFDATETGTENLSREKGVSDFTKLSGEFFRLQQLAPSWMLLGAVSWQYTFNKLLSSEEFGVGGSSFGRGFDPSEITGDQGLAFKLELQKAFKINKTYLRDLQLYTFFDYGSVWNRIETTTRDNREGRYSTGFGARLNVTDQISGFVELAKPMADRVAAEGNRDPRVFFGLSARY